MGLSLFGWAEREPRLWEIYVGTVETVSGLLNLSRNLGLIFGASALGAVFAWASPDVAHAAPPSVASGLHVTFAAALALIITAGTFAWGRNRATICPQNTR